MKTCEGCGVELSSNGRLCVRCWDARHRSCPECVDERGNVRRVKNESRKLVPVTGCARCGDRRVIEVEGVSR